ncbi:unnamed protein product, partial [Rotaria sp. Silwood1]
MKLERIVVSSTFKFQL